MTIDERCERLADDATQLRGNIEFLEGLARSRGELTMTHVYLHSAKLSAARAKEAIDRICAEADRFVKEPADA